MIRGKDERNRPPGLFFYQEIPVPKRIMLIALILFAFLTLSCAFTDMARETLIEVLATDAPAGEALVPSPVAQEEPNKPAPTITSLPPSATPAELEPTAAPTEAPPPTQPAQKGQPVLWGRIHEARFLQESMLNGVWMEIDSYPVEYEFSNYLAIPSMQLQVNEPFLVLYPWADSVRYDLRDVELESFLAIPEPNIGVALVCRQQDTAGENYTFLINQDQWWITKNAEGEASILAQGKTPESFLNGGWEVFRFRCERDRLSAYDLNGLLGEARDSTYTSGAAGTFFLNDQNVGPGVVHMFRETVLSKVTDRTEGYVRDTFQTGDLYVSYTKAWEFHGQVAEENVEGVVLSLDLNFENRGTGPVTIQHDDISLQWAEFQVEALPEAPTSIPDTYPAVFPLVVPPGEVAGGQIFFANITQMDLMEGWDLVVSLQDQGLGEMRFLVPVQ